MIDIIIVINQSLEIFGKSIFGKTIPWKNIYLNMQKDVSTINLRIFAHCITYTSINIINI